MSAPHEPVQWDVADASAFQALERGEAEPHQQKRILKWLIQNASGMNDLSYRPGDPVATAFAEGRRFVGLQIHKLTIVNTKAFTKDGK